MKKKLSILILTICVVLFTLYNIGFQVGNFTIGKQYDTVEESSKYDLDNSHFAKNYLKENQVSVITLWATWCEPCINEIPVFVKLQKDFPNIAFGMLSIDKNKEIIESTVKKLNISNDITIDNNNYRKAIRNYLENRSLKSFIKSEIVPITYIVKNGKVVYKETGAINYEDFYNKLKNTQ